MRNFIPILEIFADPAWGDSHCPERLGGVPYGLAVERWPTCKSCGYSQSFVAQFVHHPDRLDLHRHGRMLLVFECGGKNSTITEVVDGQIFIRGNPDAPICATWEPFSGANACLVLEPEEIVAGPAELPDDEPPLVNAAYIVGWDEREDGVTAEQAADFYDFDRHVALDEEVQERALLFTHLGGVPAWVQNAGEQPNPGWRFLGQLDENYEFAKAPKAEVSWVSSRSEPWEGFTHSGHGPNFGIGTAYLFARDGSAHPEVCMFWQCG